MPLHHIIGYEKFQLTGFLEYVESPRIFSATATGNFPACKVLKNKFERWPIFFFLMDLFCGGLSFLSVVEWLQEFGPIYPGLGLCLSRVQSLSTCSPVQLLDWFIKGRVVSTLPVIHAPKRPTPWHLLGIM
jgi:hypothetical protein